MFKVKDLIKCLKTLDPELPVGRSGHFGEFHEMDEHDFWITHVTPWKQTVYGSAQYTGDILHVEPPDIGDNPD